MEGLRKKVHEALGREAPADSIPPSLFLNFLLRLPAFSPDQFSSRNPKLPSPFDA